MAELFPRIARAIFAFKPPKLKSIAFDLTLAQGRCLWAVAQAENCTMRELSKKLGVSPSAACELVDRLARADLVQRANDLNDRRIVRLRLAAKGRRLFAKHKEERREHLRLFLDRLTEQQRKVMLSALESLNEVVQQVEQGKSFHTGGNG
jgi:DNA-binding MarR family transcriptional regulator